MKEPANMGKITIYFFYELIKYLHWMKSIFTFFPKDLHNHIMNGVGYAIVRYTWQLFIGVSE